MNRFSCLLLSLVSLGTLSLSAQAASDVPKNLQVPSGQELLFKMAAQGVQIYECKAKTDGAFEWTLKAPHAVLLNEAKRQENTTAGPPGKRMTVAKLQVNSKKSPLHPTRMRFPGSC